MALAPRWDITFQVMADPWPPLGFQRPSGEVHSHRRGLASVPYRLYMYMPSCLSRTKLNVARVAKRGDAHYFGPGGGPSQICHPQPSQGVRHDRPLAPLEFLAGIVTTRSRLFRGSRRLAVPNGRAGAPVATHRWLNADTYSFVHPVFDLILAPAPQMQTGYVH